MSLNWFEQNWGVGLAFLIIVLLFWFVMKDMIDLSRMSRFLSGAVVFVLLGAGVFAVFRLATEAKDANQTFGLTSLLILVALAAFILLLVYAAAAYKNLDALDRAQAFGLPAGTVRAVLTLAFIVLVGVFGSFILSSTNKRSGFGIQFEGDCQNAAAVAALRTANPKLVIVENAAVLKKDGGTCPDGGGPLVKFTVYGEADYRAADETAKTILTILSTLLSAMIGFYFGASGKDDALKAGRGNPDTYPNDRPGSGGDKPGEPADAVGSITKAVAQAGNLAELGAQLDALRTQVESITAPDSKKDDDLKSLQQASAQLAEAKSDLDEASRQAGDKTTPPAALAAAHTKAAAARDRVTAVRKVAQEMSGRRSRP